MAGARDDVKKRISVLMDVWRDIIEAWESGEPLNRDKVVDMLRGAYERAKINPLRGAAVPEDIFEKELASLYVVGKYGMGLDSQYSELFDALFADEIKYEHAIEALLTMPPEDARKRVEALLGAIDDNVLARMLRIKLAEVYFEFGTDDSLVNTIKALARAFPEKKIPVKYARFYIAFTVARAISRGEVRSRIDKEALKQALALRFKGMRGVIPDDEYIGRIATDVFGVPKRSLANILTMGNKKRRK